jgi:hypothetical protein
MPAWRLEWVASSTNLAWIDRPHNELLCERGLMTAPEESPEEEGPSPEGSITQEVGPSLSKVPP